MGVTWLLLYNDYKDPAKAAQVKKLVNWILTTGQKFNTELEFTQVPPAVAQKVNAAVSKMK